MISIKDLEEVGIKTSMCDKEVVTVPDPVTKMKMIQQIPTPPLSPNDEADDFKPLLEDGFKSIDEYQTLDFPTPLHLGLIVVPYLRNREHTPHPWQIEELEEIAKEAEAATAEHPFEKPLCACNGSGKDKIITALSHAWFALKYKRCLQVITSSSGTQLTSQTEADIRFVCECVNTFFGQPIFRIRQRYITCTLSGSVSRMFATDEPGKAEGYHPLEPNAKMIIWCGEAKSITEDIFQALLRCNGYTHWFNISTPGQPKGFFYWTCCNWKRFRRVTSYECPHIHERERERDRLLYGADSALYRSKHLALFTSEDGQVVIPLSLIERVRKLNIQHSCKHWEPRVGIDLAAGGDENSVTIARGNRVAKEDRLDFRETDTTMTARRLNDFLLARGISKESEFIFADDGGIGHAIIDMLANMGWHINRVNNQSAAINKDRFGNKGAQNWYRIRRFFEQGWLIPPDDNRLIDQLVNRYFKQSGERQRIYLESKQAAKAEGRQSPDRADSYVLAYSNLSMDEFQESVEKEEKERIKKQATGMTHDQMYEHYTRTVTFGEVERRKQSEYTVTAISELLNS